LHAHLKLFFDSLLVGEAILRPAQRARSAAKPPPS
jgi:hypothetical protein